MGGGGSSPGWEATYTPYVYAPNDYQGQNEINQTSQSFNQQSEGIIRARIIPNMINLDRTNAINRLHLEAIDSVNDQTTYFIDVYPQTVLNEIIVIEEAYQRINDYLKFFATFDKATFIATLNQHKQWFETTKAEICDLPRLAEYYKDRLIIKAAIEAAIVAKRGDYVTQCSSTTPDNIPFDMKIPEDISKDEFKIAYISEVGEPNDPNVFRLYLSMAPAQTGEV
jgi:hypothetical protein